MSQFDLAKLRPFLLLALIPVLAGAAGAAFFVTEMWNNSLQKPSKGPRAEMPVVPPVTPAQRAGHYAPCAPGVVAQWSGCMIQ